MSGHTPGPWRIDPRPFSGYGAVHVSGGQYIVAKALGQTQSCETEATANARLIAAAPDLLAALQSIVASLAEHDDEGMIEHAEQMIAARTAIAEATGEQP